MKKLIGMTDFVLDINNIVKKEYDEFISSHDSKKIRCIENHANFLSQPLTLGMFVACDDNGNVLEEPEFHEPNNENEIGDYDELRYQYQQAKSKVIFEGFSVNSENFIHNIEHYYIQKNRLRVMWNFNDGWNLYDNIKTIEDLVPYNLIMKQ